MRQQTYECYASVRAFGEMNGCIDLGIGERAERERKPPSDIHVVAVIFLELQLGLRAPFQSDTHTHARTL